ncbi:endonuclease/exonuclease/phosphatase family protein [Kribbella monticola]|uniref:endonuclease/exonuclease/phosphatase family protein n=1 Tax=Kribbella monticola TaxID=2185285 RepID=UPI000DD3E166|nr:endonuclease/exonuclease/phosphatase family protein [Kribbella monticola]
MRRFAGILAALIGLVAVGAVPPVATAAGTTVVGTYTVWSWNVAGWEINRALTDNGMVAGAVASIRTRGADFVVLNELCWQQYKAIQSRLADAGWPQDTTNFSRFERQRTDKCNNQPFGVAIFSRFPLGPVEAVTLPQDQSKEQRKLLCAPLIAQPHLRFCGTHVTPSQLPTADGRHDNANLAQLQTILSRLEQQNSNGDTTLIAGDFNAQPNFGRLDDWYDSELDTVNNRQNRGQYRELDDTEATCPGYGEATTENNNDGPCDQPTKIDLMFVRKNHLAGPYSADALAISHNCAGAACSDHRIITGTAELSIQN